jgi:dienelactone hydrolase
MSTKLLDSRTEKQLQPSFSLWKQYRPDDAKFAFSAKDVAAAKTWQKTTRMALSDTVGFQNGPAVPLRPRSIERVEKAGYLREKIVLTTAPQVQMPVYLLTPEGIPGPWPVVIAFHGHGYGVKDIVGLWEDGEEREKPDGYHKDFAVELCRRGFAVAAPEISCFGERQTDFSYLSPGQGEPTTCTHTATLAFHQGGSVVGLRARDGMRLIDYLETRADFDTTRLGAMGISGGGLHTLFSTCLDERIKACVISGYFCTFRDSILAMSHCLCNFVPGLGQFGEMSDLVGLVAPRPMLVESGSYDPIFPVASVKKSVTKAKRVYKAFGISNGIDADYFEGRHQISGRKAYDFLADRLRS